MRETLRGKRYIAEKKERVENLKQNAPKRQNDASENTAEKLAAEYNVSPRTIERDAEFAAGVDAIARGGELGHCEPVKKATANPAGKNQYGEVGGQNDPQPKTAAKLADEYGVSRNTIKRDANAARGTSRRSSKGKGLI